MKELGATGSARSGVQQPCLWHDCPMEAWSPCPCPGQAGEPRLRLDSRLWGGECGVIARGAGSEALRAGDYAGLVTLWAQSKLTSIRLHVRLALVAGEY